MSSGGLFACCCGWVLCHPLPNARCLFGEPVNPRPKTVEVTRIPQSELTNCRWLQPGFLGVALNFCNDDVRVHSTLFAIWLTFVNWQVTNCTPTVGRDRLKP